MLEANVGERVPSLRARSERLALVLSVVKVRKSPEAVPAKLVVTAL